MALIENRLTTNLLFGLYELKSGVSNTFLYNWYDWLSCETQVGHKVLTTYLQSNAVELNLLLFPAKQPVPQIQQHSILLLPFVVQV